MNSQVAVENFRNSVIEDYLKKCVKNDNNILNDLDEIADFEHCQEFYYKLTDRLCSGNGDDFNINDYIDREGIDINRMFYDDDDVLSCWWKCKAERIVHPVFGCPFNNKRQMLTIYSKAYVYYYLRDGDEVDDDNIMLRKIANCFGLTHTRVGVDKYDIAFEEEEEHEECRG